ncbi:MAG: hypothetical protein OEU95_01920 [Nitrospirota bacterium]|nr:hypothetical protein [Nitrospirota bacterium]
MLYMAIFDAKEDTTMQDITREREEWFRMGKDKLFRELCHKIDRYEIVGKSPLRIIFIIDTDNPRALNMLSRHFGNEWISRSYPALHRELYDAMEEDKSIIGG